MPNPISKSEAQFKLRNVIAKLSIAASAAKEGDWRIAFDNAYEAQDLLGPLVDHIEEALNELANQRDTRPLPEPPGSLKYGVPPGTPERSGGLGYRGSNHSRPPEPVTVDVTASSTYTSPIKRDLRPPKPIIIPPPPTPPPPAARGPIITPPPPPIVTPPPAPKPAPKPLPIIPEGAEVVTLDINRLIDGVITDTERKQMAMLDSLPDAFRQSVLTANALSNRPVTIFRVGDIWSIYR